MSERKINHNLNPSFNQDISTDKVLLSNGHNYSQCCAEGEDLKMLILDEKEFPALPVTPSESPAAKKKTTQVRTSPSDSDIIGMLSQLINERSDSI